MSHIIRKYKDRLGRQVTLSKLDNGKYSIFTKLGVTMMSYTFPNRELFEKEVNNKFKPILHE